jgi:hypothetical protein
VDELKTKIEKTEREFEEFKRQQQEEYIINYVRISCISALLLVTLSLQLRELDAANICGLVCGLMCWFDMVKLC